MNKYYVYHSDGICDGAYTFKEALKEREYWDKFGELCMILKVVVDTTGKEVK